MANFYAFLVLVGAAVCTASNDEMSEVKVQLCKDKIDMDCVRDYFSKNARCDVKTQNERKPIEAEILPIYVPFLNLTVVAKTIELTNSVGEFKAFYMNQKTGDLIIAVKFDALTCNAPDTIFAIARDEMEPKVLSTYINATYHVVLTMVIPADEEITIESLQKALFYAYFETPTANIVLGPKLTQSEDPLVQNVIQGLLANIPLALQEIFLTKAQYFSLAFLQEHICDFGAPLAFKEYDPTALKAACDKDTTDESAFKMPCADSDDMKSCVRKFFGEHSSCSVVSETDDKPVNRKEFTAYVPAFNTSAITHDAALSVDGMISKIYVDKKTNNLVLSVDFEGIVNDAEKLTFVIDEKASEPMVSSGDLKCTYPVKITAVIPMMDGKITTESINIAYMSPYFTSDPTYEFGPSLTDSKNEQVQRIISGIHNMPVVVGQEVFIDEAHDYFLAYLQKYICDFGIAL